jgi:SAM-dependent methyltransferase
MNRARGTEASEAAAIARAYDFSGNIRVIVVGGGAGALLATLLQSHQRLTGVVFDRPQVIAPAERLFEEMGVVDRASWAGGDFFCALPGGGDIYLLRSVLHNWNDADAARLLRCCRRAMAEGARLLIAEPVTPGGAGSTADDASVVSWSSGDEAAERTEDDYRALFRATGFAWSRTIETESPLSLIEAIAVKPSV